MQRVSEQIVLHFMMLIPRKIAVGIILQIWRNSFSRRLTRFAIRVIAESGLLYTLTSIATCCAVFLSPDHWFVIAIGIVCHNELNAAGDRHSSKHAEFSYRRNRLQSYIDTGGAK